MPSQLTLPLSICICRDPNCTILFGTCHCGCGTATPIAIRNSTSNFSVIGRPIRFVHGHGKSDRSSFNPEECPCGDENCKIPRGLCHCGCGGITEVSKQTRIERGVLAGYPQKYLRGHIINQNRSPQTKKVEWPEGLCVCGDRNCQVQFGHCHCGCGNRTPISDYSHRKLGYVSGLPRKFIPTHNTKPEIPLAVRFWDKIDKDGEMVRSEIGRCWAWKASTDAHGYGQISGEKK